MIEKLKVLSAYAGKRWTLASLSSGADVAARQQKLLRQLQQHAATHFAFYKQFENIDFSSWPVIDKSMMMQNFDGMNACGLTAESAWDAAEEALKSDNSSAEVGNFTVGTSTGTSGQRGLFVVSAEERVLWLGSILARCLPDFPFVKHRVAVMLATGNRLYNTANTSGRLGFSFFDLKQGVECHVASLRRFAPDVLIASPKAVRAIAELNAPLNLKHIFTGGEVLDPLDSAPIAKWSGINPRSIYQATEGFLGVACPLGHVHLNEDDILFEEEPVPGHPSHFIPVITDLRRRSQAMIRYRLNDVLVKHGGLCPCGSPLMALTRIEGRLDDILEFVTETSTKTIRIMPEVLRAVILDSDRTITEFQLVQTSNELLSLGIKSPQLSLSKKLAEEALRKYLASFSVADRIAISVHELTDTKSSFESKHRRIKGRPKQGQQ